MTIDQIEDVLGRAIHNERESIREVIAAIALAEQNKVYAARAYSSMFEYLKRYWKYPPDAAQRRLAAARLVLDVPAAIEKLDDGTLNLTVLSKTRSAIRAQEKATGQKLTNADKAHVVSAVENLSSRQADQTLFKLLPAAAQPIPMERVVAIDKDSNKVTLCLDNQDVSFLDKARDILAHAIPDGAYGKVIGRVLRDFVNCSNLTRRTLGQACEFIDDKTGHICGSTFMLERDHMVPVALGGLDADFNRRWLCKPHNLLMAERLLGQEWANSYRRGGRI